MVLLPKVETPRDLDDLQPIALTIALAKVCKRCILHRVCDHTSISLAREQHAYRHKHSTIIALTALTHNWLSFLDERDSHYVRSSFIDFSKAFDSVEPALISAKLLLSWFVCFVFSFLTRIQYVRVDSVMSDALFISKGLPQGTILGPTFFSIMVNDMKPVDPLHAQVIR